MNKDRVTLSKGHACSWLLSTHNACLWDVGSIVRNLNNKAPRCFVRPVTDVGSPLHTQLACSNIVVSRCRLTHELLNGLLSMASHHITHTSKHASSFNLQPTVGAC